MDYTVRRIHSGEWREYRELRLEALQDSPLAFVEQYDDALARPDQFWRDRVEGNASGTLTSMFVIEHAERLVGNATCVVDPEITEYVSAHLLGIYVSPQLRGTSAAQALLTELIQWARQDAKADRIRLFVMDTNLRAVAFYRRLGFVPTGATMAYPPDPRYTESEMEYRRAQSPAAPTLRP